MWLWVFMVDGTPSSSVFTTCRFDETGRVLAFDLHFNRLKEAAKQIRCPPPDIKIISTILSKSINDYGNKEGLARLAWSSEGQASCETRLLEQPNSPLVAITHPAPQWPRRFRGIKNEQHSKKLVVPISQGHESYIILCCAELVPMWIQS